MRSLPKPLVALAGLVACSVALPAQAARYELGRRVRDFEVEWSLARPDAAAKKRVVPHLQAAVTAFFTLRTADVARELALARHALRSETPPDPATTWAQSIAARPTRVLLDPTASEITVSLESLFAIATEPPQDARLVVELLSESDKEPVAWLEQKGLSPPAKLRLPLDPKRLSEREHLLEARVFVGDAVLARSASRVTLAARLEPRLEALEQAVAELGEAEPTSDGETLRALVRLLRALAAGKVQEVDHPALALLADAEALVKARGRDSRWPAGDHLVRLVAAGRICALRVFVPNGLEREAPLVVALHGAGGSENMFFQTYGAGAIVRHARELGWVLVAPRGGFAGADPSAFVSAVAAKAPVDRKRVFLVGHSLGALQAAEAAPALPDLAGLALLGGSAPVRGDWSKVPVFVGIGDADFALPGARATVAALRRAGCARLKAAEYPDIEHLAVVAVALPDVFRFFTGAQ